MEIPPPHLLSFGPAADLQSLTFADGHLESERDPDVSQILRPRVKGEALHVALLPATRMHSQVKVKLQVVLRHIQLIQMILFVELKRLVDYLINRKFIGN